MEFEGSTQVCVTLDSTPESEVNIVLETDDTPTAAQGEIYTSHFYISLLSRIFSQLHGWASVVGDTCSTSYYQILVTPLK